MEVLSLLLQENGAGFWAWIAGLNILMGILGFFIGGLRGNPWLGLILGLLLGPIGILIAIVLPRRTPG